jgi:hypothetical protein
MNVDLNNSSHEEQLKEPLLPQKKSPLDKTLLYNKDDSSASFFLYDEEEEANIDNTVLLAKRHIREIYGETVKPT